MPLPVQHFATVEFYRFKAFEDFYFKLRHMNVLVGPNNAGKSTILTAFRILAAGMRRANSKRPTLVRTIDGPAQAYEIDLAAISIAEENIFFNYDDSEPAYVKFTLSDQNALRLYFPEQEVCYLIPEPTGKAITSPTTFRATFDCPVSFVPILGPVEHNEPLYEREAARLALTNYGAARNFRNIWHHYPERFDEFRQALITTWPGMDVQRPERDLTHDKPRLHMYCPEQRIPRELFWAGFGFQVWCQMLTYLIQSKDASIFLIDEPDIYLHSELQRQLVGLLRKLGPDVLIATHSTEIITEADGDEIVVVTKGRKTAKRIKDSSLLGEVFSLLGSNMNPVLTQLAKTRRAVFVEGKDFQIIARFARKLGFDAIGNRRDFAVIPIEGFNPERARSLLLGMEASLGLPILSALILDGDFRSINERTAIENNCKSFSARVRVHSRKEIENFLLVPDAIDRTIKARIDDRRRRTGISADFSQKSADILDRVCEGLKIQTISRLIAERKRFERLNNPKLSEVSVSEAAMVELELRWKTSDQRYAAVAGKEVLAQLNGEVQQSSGVNVTPLGIIENMHLTEIPAEMSTLVRMLSEFAQESPGGVI